MRSHGITQQQADSPETVAFLTRPDRGHPHADESLTRLALVEINALDKYLQAHAGDEWEEGKYRHGLSLQATHWASLWPVRVAARLFLIEREKGNPAWRDVLKTCPEPLCLRRFVAGAAGDRNIVVIGAFLDLELTRTFHPSTVGARLFCENPEGARFDDIARRYANALDFLALHDPLGFSVFTNSVTAIAPLALEPALESGKCFSMAIGTAPGLVLLTAGPLVLLAETLLHEAAHNRLSALGSLACLWHNGSLRVKSPLRPDARPISGLYHQAYVLFHLCRYYACIQKSRGEPAVERNSRQIDKRSQEFKDGFIAAVETLRTHSSELTSDGIDVLEAMATECPA